MRHDPDGRRLPIKLDATSNGEVAPMPLTSGHWRCVRQRFQAWIRSMDVSAQQMKGPTSESRSSDIRCSIRDTSGTWLPPARSGRRSPEPNATSMKPED